MTGLGIAGVALVAMVAAGLGLACWAQRREIDRLRCNLAEEQARLDMWQKLADKHARGFIDRTTALANIAAATAKINHGTARKVHRMASEALK